MTRWKHRIIGLAEAHRDIVRRSRLDTLDQALVRSSMISSARTRPRGPTAGPVGPCITFPAPT